MKLFVDENLPPQLARGLAALFNGDHEVICHRDKFGMQCRLDEEWIPELGREGDWVVLSGDVNIARKRPQRELFFRSNLVGFFPRPAVMELPLAKKAARILSVWERMVGISRDVRPGVFELQQRGDQFRAL
ncbi:hypothetical protein RZN05_11945 [Sphingomonas sp. HF-S4]|uniref:VapC45 PIN like domain-containing protein n=1 Tax=Sphingomonas agrestis TaxID=3080540 RepID=A0ABU3Y8J7_9SPHN|nr:hypothetical protein [Sphingomonas sp. HF-S4]MDV3457699.1 hypothetical protein [Sphingomonas sp. HF-S4]